MEHIYDAAVVGGGIAGFSAALSLGSLNLDYLWIGETEFGEKVKKSEYVRNYPSFVGDGQRFYEALARQKEKEKIRFTAGRVDGIYRVKEMFSVSATPEMYSARTVILCTGVNLKGKIKGESDFLGRGVSYCAVCDGALYRGKTVAAVIDSPSLTGEAEYLAGFAKTVYAFTAADAAFEHDNIRLCHDCPRSIEGDARVQRLVSDRKTYDVDGVFLLRKAVPPEALAGGVGTDGVHVVTGKDMSTNIGGLFAAGDITGLPYQYAKAAGEGLVAAHSAKRYLRENFKDIAAF